MSASFSPASRRCFSSAGVISSGGIGVLDDTRLAHLPSRSTTGIRYSRNINSKRRLSVYSEIKSREEIRPDAYKTRSRLSLLSDDAGAAAIEPHCVQAGGRPLDDRALQLGALGRRR